MIKLEDKPDVEAPGVDYEFGSIRDRAGAVPGTPVSRQVYSDIHQFFERLMQLAEITANGLPDNTTNGYQLAQAFGRMATGNAFSNIYGVEQSGTSAPTLTLISPTDILPFSGTSPSRTGVGRYEIAFTPSLSSIDALPNGVMLIASSGQASTSATETVNCFMQAGKIMIETDDGGVPTDGILDNYIFELKLVSQSIIF